VESAVWVWRQTQEDAQPAGCSVLGGSIVAAALKEPDGYDAWPVILQCPWVTFYWHFKLHCGNEGNESLARMRR